MDKIRQDNESPHKDNSILEDIFKKFQNHDKAVFRDIFDGLYNGSLKVESILGHLEKSKKNHMHDTFFEQFVKYYFSHGAVYPPFIELCSQHNNKNVRAIIAEYYREHDILMRLAQDPSDDVRIGLAKNTRLTSDILQSLLNDSSNSVRLAVITGPASKSMTDKMWEQMLSDTCPRCRAVAFAHCKCDPSTLINPDIAYDFRSFLERIPKDSNTPIVFHVRTALEHRAILHQFRYNTDFRKYAHLITFAPSDPNQSESEYQCDTFGDHSKPVHPGVIEYLRKHFNGATLKLPHQTASNFVGSPSGELISVADALTASRDVNRWEDRVNLVDGDYGPVREDVPKELHPIAPAFHESRMPNDIILSFFNAEYPFALKRIPKDYSPNRGDVGILRGIGGLSQKFYVICFDQDVPNKKGAVFTAKWIWSSDKKFNTNDRHPLRMRGSTGSDLDFVETRAVYEEESVWIPPHTETHSMPLDRHEDDDLIDNGYIRFEWEVEVRGYVKARSYFSHGEYISIGGGELFIPMKI